MVRLDAAGSSRSSWPSKNDKRGGSTWLKPPGTAEAPPVAGRPGHRLAWRWRSGAGPAQLAFWAIQGPAARRGDGLRNQFVLLFSENPGKLADPRCRRILDSALGHGPQGRNLTGLDAEGSASRSASSYLNLRRFGEPGELLFQLGRCGSRKAFLHQPVAEEAGQSALAHSGCRPMIQEAASFRFASAELSSAEHQ